jgi:hypothetical protein
MAFDEPDEETPNVIQTADDARAAAQCVLDYADYNLTLMEASDCPLEKIEKIHAAAKALVEALA